MSIMQYVSVKPRKAEFAQSRQINFDTSLEHLELSSLVSFIIPMLFVSVDNAISMQPPVQVKNDVIKVKEHLMKENTPYAISYRGKDYVVSKANGTTQLFELKD